MKHDYTLKHWEAPRGETLDMLQLLKSLPFRSYSPLYSAESSLADKLENLGYRPIPDHDKELYRRTKQRASIELKRLYKKMLKKNLVTVKKVAGNDVYRLQKM